MVRRLGRIFAGIDGGKLKPDNVRRALLRDLLKPLAGEFPQNGQPKVFIDGRLHSFRHYYCSVLASDPAMSEHDIKQVMGHQSSEMVARCVHPFEDSIARNIESLGSQATPCLA